MAKPSPTDKYLTEVLPPTTEDPRKTSSHYPYTYACDYIRMLGPVRSSGVVLSRGDASQIMEGISKALDMDNEDLAKKLADAELVNEDDPESLKKNSERILRALNINNDPNYFLP